MTTLANASEQQSFWVQEASLEALDLRSVLSVVLAEHPLLRARRAEVGAAQSEVDAARWQYWPTPSVSVQRPDKALIVGADRSVTMFNVKQPLWTGGRLQAGLAYAEARQQTAQATSEETRRDLALELIQAWGEACTAGARVVVYETSAASHRKFLGQIQRRTQAGLSVQSDIALAGSRFEALQADLANALSALASAQERLRTLVGRGVGKPVLSAPWSQDDGLATAVQQALEIDPTLVRLKSEEAELRAQADSSKSTFWPELNASVSQRQGDVTGRATQISIGFESKWGAGLSNLAAVQGAAQRLQAKQEEIEYRTRKIAEQIRGEQAQLVAARARVQAFRQALNAAKAVTESWDHLFVAGKKTWQDVMNAVRESTQTEIQLVDAMGAASITDWRLAVLTRGVDSVLQSSQEKP